MAQRPDNELTVAELKFWRRFMEGMGAFDGALNRQLQADSGISDFGVRSFIVPAMRKRTASRPWATQSAISMVNPFIEY